MRKLIPPVAVLLACAALSAALAYAAAPKNLGRAIDAQRVLIAERPMDSALENDLGSLLVLGDDLEGAERAYRRAIEIDGGNASAHYNLGLLLQKQGERRAALKEFERTLEIAPRHAWAQYQVGTIYDAQGRDSAARKAYAKAIALDPALGNPVFNPHLIDNEHATSAMLYAYHHYREELQPAKEFEAPARIAGVLIDRPASDADAIAAAGAQEGDGGFVKGSGAPDSSGAGEISVDSGVADEKQQGESAGEAAAESRVLTSKDLDPSRASGQIVGGGSPGRPSSLNKGGQITSSNRGRTRDTQQPVRPTLRPPSSTGSVPPPQVAPPTTFLPTSDSTGMIEVHLVEIDAWS